jgi:hypothetical protein
MAGPVLGNQGFKQPPDEFRNLGGDNVADYMQLIHTILFGPDNEQGAVAPAAGVAAVNLATVLIQTANAGGAYGAPERALINELKEKVNTLGANQASLAATLNELIASLKAGGFVAT